MLFFYIDHTLILAKDIIKVLIKNCWLPFKNKIFWVWLELRNLLDLALILIVVMIFLRIYFELEGERRAFSLFRLKRNIALILLNDLFWNGQTQTNSIFIGHGARCWEISSWRIVKVIPRIGNYIQSDAKSTNSNISWYGEFHR